jgi:hypothetical protein
MHYTNNNFNCIVIDKYHTLSEIDHHLNYIYKKCDIVKYKSSKVNDCTFTITIVFTNTEKKYCLQNLVQELILLEFSMNRIKELILDSFSLKEITLDDKSIAYCIIEQN